MIAEAAKFEDLLKANGVGAFGRVEYDGRGNVILRTWDMKTADMSGIVRVYHNNQREQLMTGRRFDPMPSGLLLLRPLVFYRVYSTIEIVKPIPDGVSAIVRLRDDSEDVMAITTPPFYAGFTGQIVFTVLPYRKVEIEKMTTLASLMFFEETASIDGEWLEAVESEVYARVLKKVNSVRTKKTQTVVKKSVKTAAKAKPKEEKADEGSAPDERADDTEG